MRFSLADGETRVLTGFVAGTSCEVTEAEALNLESVESTWLTAVVEEPTDEPTGEPTDEPTGEPTTEPTTEPTGEPTTEPTEQPGEEPSDGSVEGRSTRASWWPTTRRAPPTRWSSATPSAPPSLH
ncbi:hypothetical protein G7085_16335 [Tessaracoccus sp. HDW20]|nr:hypothetical protein [Tessaracoccus coleopterorum]